MEEKLIDFREEKKKFEESEKENLRLKIVSGEAKSGWKKDRNMIERDNPDTGKLEFYKCPINFDHNKIVNLKYLDEKRLMISFFHKGVDEDWDTFKMVTDAYLWLCGELPEQKRASKINIYDIKDETDAKNYIKSIGRSTKGKYITRVLRFLITRRGDTFDIEEFDDECGFKGQRESRRQYIKKLIDWGFIEETKTQGIYRIIF